MDAHLPEHERDLRPKRLSGVVPLAWKVRAGRLLGMSMMAVRTSIGTIHIRPRDTDADVFENIFVRRRPYDLGPFPQQARVVDAYRRILSSGDLPVIVDAGANVGAASRWFARAFPEAAIVAIEPDPGSAAVCRKNLIAVPRAQVIEAAIGSTPGHVEVLPAAESLGTRTVRSSSGGVRIVTVDDALHSAGEKARPFIAKIDIEGFERDLFSANTGWIAKMPVVMVEPHDWRFPGERTSAPVLKAFAASGHELLITGGDTLTFVL